MNEVMLALGQFRFSIETAAYQTLTRTQGWTWIEQARVGDYPLLQMTGKDAPTITLRGTIYPEYRGGYEQVGLMAAEADMGQPLDLLAFDNSVAGVYLGRWVIMGLNEEQGVFRSNGAPRRIEFIIVLKRYSE